jgi:hypothetical protein
MIRTIDAHDQETVRPGCGSRRSRTGVDTHVVFLSAQAAVASVGEAATIRSETEDARPVGLFRIASSVTRRVTPATSLPKI